MSEPQRDYFRDYHRASSRTMVARVVSLGAVGAVVVALVSALTLGGPSASEPSAALPIPTFTSGPQEVAPAVEPITVEPVADAPPPSPLPTTAAPPPSASAEPRTWSIHIDTTGYQAEIDQCLWVRMDLGIEAPVVGAHNYCGGSVVLEMAIGDLVTLSGTGLDGTYRVSEERLAYAGDDAAAATAGFRAAVILQTCYWIDDGSERLLALLPAS